MRYRTDNKTRKNDQEDLPSSLLSLPSFFSDPETLAPKVKPVEPKEDVADALPFPNRLVVPLLPVLGEGLPKLIFPDPKENAPGCVTPLVLAKFDPIEGVFEPAACPNEKVDADDVVAAAGAVFVAGVEGVARVLVVPVAGFAVELPPNENWNGFDPVPFVDVAGAPNEIGFEELDDGAPKEKPLEAVLGTASVDVEALACLSSSAFSSLFSSSSSSSASLSSSESFPKALKNPLLGKANVG